MVWLEKLVTHYRKAAVGFGAGTALNGGFVALVKEPGLFLTVAVGVTAYIVCGLGAWFWARFVEGGFDRKRIDIDEAADSQVLIRPEDHLAHVANKCARRYFGRRTISFEEYRRWRRHNPLIFTAVVGRDRELFGFFDIFPLTDVAGSAIREGLKGEQNINLEDVLPEGDIERANYVYVATVMSCVANEYFKARLIELMSELVFRLYPPREGRVYLAFAASAEGRNLLKRNNFILELNAEITKAKLDLFVLPYERVPDALRRVGRRRRPARRRLAASGIPVPA